MGKDPQPGTLATTVGVIAEGQLTEQTGREAIRFLGDGVPVLILAQRAAAASHYPIPVTAVPIDAGWGSSVYTFTTGATLPALPARALLITEDAAIQAHNALRIPQPGSDHVVAFRPAPNGLTGTIIGSYPTRRASVTVCQYRLTTTAAAGDPMAISLLTDVLHVALNT